MEAVAAALQQIPLYDLDDILRNGLRMLLRRGLATLDDMRLLCEVEDEMIAIGGSLPREFEDEIPLRVEKRAA
jgi:hypothetical protein